MLLDCTGCGVKCPLPFVSLRGLLFQQIDVPSDMHTDADMHTRITLAFAKRVDRTVVKCRAIATVQQPLSANETKSR